MPDSRAQMAEWEAWQLVVSRFRALVGDINDDQYLPLVQAIEAWGEWLVALRSTQPAEVVSRARYEKVLAAK